MTDETERLKQQHKEELDLAQEVIVNLRRDLAHAHKRIHSQDAVWNEAIDAALEIASYEGSPTCTYEGIEELKRPMI